MVGKVVTVLADGGANGMGPAVPVGGWGHRKGAGSAPAKLQKPVQGTLLASGSRRYTELLSTKVLTSKLAL